jgi:hypothetical protein
MFLIIVATLNPCLAAQPGPNLQAADPKPAMMNAKTPVNQSNQFLA